MTTPIQNRSIIRLSQAIKKAQTQICELVPFLTKIPIFYGTLVHQAPSKALIRSYPLYVQRLALRLNAVEC
ncbi:Uncharacterised protein [Vibrio cholerae]|nr:Uncharacterised protein [Vibrio cholerae]CSI50233.1 Uncharacterised protein [Vibrio cholerae]CSI55312.1 Uncharacterised protein [Vibrio cholerae]